MQRYSEPKAPRPFFLWSVVLVGILSIASASILIRLVQAPALVIATYRVALASIIIAPYFAIGEIRQRSRWNAEVVRATLLSGLFLALHFAFWIQSLKLTTVASSVTLVNTTPLFVALFSFRLFRERPTKKILLGIALTIAGGALVAGADYSLSRNALRGDFLALLGAIMAAAYLVSGKYARRSLNLVPYISGAYGFAAVLLIVCSLVAQIPLLGYSLHVYLILLLLAVIPQLIGHSTFNWTLRFLPATVVAVLILGEPIGATLLAYLLLQETVSWVQGAGLVVLGAGILCCSLATGSK